MNKTNTQLVINAVRTAEHFDQHHPQACTLAIATTQIEALRKATPEIERSTYNIEAFAKFCGITERQGYAICYPRYKMHGGDKQRVLKMLRNLKKTGRVKWN